jgi:hypothetical protein
MARRRSTFSIFSQAEPLALGPLTKRKIPGRTEVRFILEKSVADLPGWA